MKPILDGTKKTRSHWHTLFHKHRPLITVDFDHTITKTCPACPDWNGTRILQDGVKEALTELHKTFDIIILSGGGHYDSSYRKIIKQFLEEHSIPYTRIVINKPPATFMIDDRAIHHKGWTSTLKELKRRMTTNKLSK